MKPTTVAAMILFGLAQPALANIDIQFDFSHDGGFFTGANSGRQATLDAAATVFEQRFADSLNAITSDNSNHFGAEVFDPTAPNGPHLSLPNQSVAANVIRIYVGGYNFGGRTLGLSSPGGYQSCSGTGSFCTPANLDRGQASTVGPSAVDFAPWGGSISFNSGTNWNFSATSGPSSSQLDFYSVAVHELGHVLGFGTAYSFRDKVSNGQFSGSATGTINLSSDGGHWADGTKSFVNGELQDDAMTPSIGIGQRKYFTDLDFNAMKDIGWQVTAVPEADTWAMFVAGLGLIGFTMRHRSRQTER